MTDQPQVVAFSTLTRHMVFMPKPFRDYIDIATPFLSKVRNLFDNVLKPASDKDYNFECNKYAIEKNFPATFLKNRGFPKG